MVFLSFLSVCALCLSVSLSVPACAACLLHALGSLSLSHTLCPSLCAYVRDYACLTWWPGGRAHTGAGWPGGR
jgi:hypothetical protein